LFFHRKGRQTRRPDLLVVAGKPVHQVHSIGPGKLACLVEAFEEVLGRRPDGDGFVAKRDGRCCTFAEMIEAGLKGEQRVARAARVRKDTKPAVRFRERDQQPAGAEGPLIERV
jgi:hypothetical protein